VQGAQIEAETTLRRAERAVHGDLPEESVLLDIEEGVAVRLNRTGSLLWDELEKPQRVEDLARTLSERFGVEEGSALGDVVAFAREMVGRNLLEVAQ
jgi:Coenzyme PQQ synthesis protein D (PqqD)